MMIDQNISRNLFQKHEKWSKQLSAFSQKALTSHAQKHDQSILIPLKSPQKFSLITSKYYSVKVESWVRILYIENNYVISIGTKFPIKAIKHLYEYAHKKEIISDIPKSDLWTLSPISNKNVIDSIKQKGIKFIELGISSYANKIKDAKDKSILATKIQGLQTFFGMSNDVQNEIQNSFYKFGPVLK